MSHHSYHFSAILAITCLTVSNVTGYCGCSSWSPVQAQHFQLNDLNHTRNTSSVQDDQSKVTVKIDDMLMPIDDFRRVAKGGLRSPASPGDYINCRRLWPKGIVYYKFAPNYPTSYFNTIRTALATLSLRTRNLVTFKEVAINSRITRPHVKIINGDGCWSYVGMISRHAQELSLSTSGCVTDWVIQHEFMHALGFEHEQSRYDRDDSVTIHWDNILSEMCLNFEKSYYLIRSDFPGYDYNSIMHYPSFNSFACVSRRPTISMKNGTVINGVSQMSDLDVEKLVYFYSKENLNYCFNLNGETSQQPLVESSAAHSSTSSSVSLWTVTQNWLSAMNCVALHVAITYCAI